ncbi:MAG: TIGR03960 family B12-binding radical SAM protein [Deltaproteobacteria bacterium]
MNDDILSQVMKPGRYIGREWNVPQKDFDKTPVKFALCFPDLYEVGMSNLGLRIIYDILNKIPDVSCERFFSPALDMENILRSRCREVFSLETGRIMRDFDLAGFSLGYELCYTNVLNMLDLSGIPLKSEMRGQTHPLIIAGGPCALNPEPMHGFFDLFVIGEAEEAIVQITDAYGKHKEKFRSGRMSKEELLAILSNIEGVYAPALYETEYAAGGGIISFGPKVGGIPRKVKKRFVRDLDNASFPVDWLVPYIETIHDRISLEIMRGCPNQCRFCQARHQYYPMRKRSADNIFNLALQAYGRSGYEEISLGGLSVSDYPGIEKVVESLIGSFKEKGVSISLPSIKPRAIVGELSPLIASIKKTGLTFAPEAASEKLRRILNKDFDIDEFFKVLEKSYLCGYNRVKLYFMTGLPLETDSDLDAIADLANRASQARRSMNLASAWVNVSVNTLVPKPHTAFQWFKMQDLEGMQCAERYLKNKIHNRKIEINFHNSRMSFMEGVLSRGDRRLGEVILRAFTKGARFDAWESHFSFNLWMEAFRESGVDPDFYLAAKSTDEILPWDFLDMGVDKNFLKEEFNKCIAMG